MTKGDASRGDESDTSTPGTFQPVFPTIQHPGNTPATFPVDHRDDTPPDASDALAPEALDAPAPDAAAPLARRMRYPA